MAHSRSASVCVRYASLARAEAQRIVAARALRVPQSIAELARAADLNRGALQKLAAAGALGTLSAHRHEASWLALGAERPAGSLQLEAATEPPVSLPAPSEAQEILADYRQLTLSTTRHPLVLLRGHLRRLNIRSTLELRALADGVTVRAAGLITHLQQPGTASGVVFLSLEDETGILSVILWPQVFEHTAQRRTHGQPYSSKRHPAESHWRDAPDRATACTIDRGG